MGAAVSTDASGIRSGHHARLKICSSRGSMTTSRGDIAHARPSATTTMGAPTKLVRLPAQSMKQKPAVTSTPTNIVSRRFVRSRVMGERNMTHTK